MSAGASDLFCEVGDGLGNGVGSCEVEFAAACWVLGVADGADAGGVADLDVGD